MIRRELHFGDRVMPCYAERAASVDALMRAAASANPGGDAVVDGALRLSHMALDSAVTRLAAGLAGAGLAPGARLAMLVGNRHEFVTVLLAGIRAGLIVVPIGTRLSALEVAFILGDCGAQAVVHGPGLAGSLPPGVDGPAHRIALDSPAFAALAGADPSGFAPPPLAEEDTAVILYTSGTTGRPKGAMLTHLNLVASCRHYADVWALTAADRSLMAVPASHVTGLVANVLTILSVGGALLVLPAFEVAAFLDLAARERMTHTLMVPAMYNLCLLRGDLAAHDLSAWRIGGFGGAPMPEATISALAEALPKLALRNAYGATETASPATMMPLGEPGRTESVGRAVPCGDIRIMDAAGREMPAGEPGEIWVAGPMVVPGYWNRPEATAESFRGGYWRSGDVGAMDAQGYLRVFDRLKDMVNRGGYKVFSVEVENALAAHPAVAEAAIVPQPDPVLGEKVHAFVHPKPGATLTLDEARAFCARHLADYKRPDALTLCPDPLPRNANGKLLKRALRDRLARVD